MKLTNLLKKIVQPIELDAKTIAFETGLNETWVKRTLRGENTMVKLDALFEYLTESTIIEVQPVPSTIAFKMISESGEYYSFADNQRLK